jgi:hypothetical protein
MLFFCLQVLTSLAYFHMTHSNNPKSALSCISAIRQMEVTSGACDPVLQKNSTGNHPAVSCVALRALIALGEFEQAAEEMLGRNRL